MASVMPVALHSRADSDEVWEGAQAHFSFDTDCLAQTLLSPQRPAVTVGLLADCLPS